MSVNRQKRIIAYMKKQEECLSNEGAINMESVIQYANFSYKIKIKQFRYLLYN